jgi:diguanylate cyclase (GGDEF)-like protein/PAS domain S-box-containing protein
VSKEPAPITEDTPQLAHRRVAVASSVKPTNPSDSSSAHLKGALSKVSDAVITSDLQNRITYMNGVAEALTQWSAQRAEGQMLADVLSIVDAETGTDIDFAVRTACQPQSSSDRKPRGILLGGDRSIVIEYSVSAIRREDGSLDGAVTIFRDIMRRRLAEVALQASDEKQSANADALFVEKERAHVTLNSIGEAVISTDFRGRVTFLNRIAEAMTGLTQRQAGGLPLTEVFPLLSAHDRQPVACPGMRAIIEDSTVRLDMPSVLAREGWRELAVDAAASPIHDPSGGVVGAVLVAHDVTAARSQTEKLARLALYDSLTAIPNRFLLGDRLQQALERAQRSEGRVAVIFIDLDRFKPVNDLQGHLIGDKVLQEVARRLLTCLRNSDTVGRYGGDEFVVILSEIARGQDAALCAAKVIAALNLPFKTGKDALSLGASVGISLYPADAQDAATLIKLADTAMYRAKSAGRNRFEFYRAESTSIAEQPTQGKMELE